MKYTKFDKTAFGFDKVLEPKAVSSPQHISFEATSDRLIYIFTGILNVGHGAGRTGTALTGGFPGVGFFGTGQGNGKVGILNIEPTGHPGRFVGAVSTVSLANVDSKGDSRVGVDSIQADLRTVVLKPSDMSILGVVLTVNVEAQEGVLGWVGYQVTVVLNNHFAASPHPLILVGDPEWDGTYGDIGDIVTPGVPQP